MLERLSGFSELCLRRKSSGLGLEEEGGLLEGEVFPGEAGLDFEGFAAVSVCGEGGGEEHFAAGEEGCVAGVDF